MLLRREPGCPCAGGGDEEENPGPLDLHDRFCFCRLTMFVAPTTTDLGSDLLGLRRRDRRWSARMRPQCLATLA